MDGKRAKRNSPSTALVIDGGTPADETEKHLTANPNIDSEQPSQTKIPDLEKNDQSKNKTQDLEKNKPSKTESPHLDTSKPEIPTPVSPNDVQLEKQKSKKIYETGSKKANKGKSKAAKAKA